MPCDVTAVLRQGTLQDRARHLVRQAKPPIRPHRGVAAPRVQRGVLRMLKAGVLVAQRLLRITAVAAAQSVKGQPRSTLPSGEGSPDYRAR